ncbi:MAG TPA: argininosuccinate lyase, partial [Thermoleophilia bacterium]|nr:argininosuccinate lyase [Thermoleophilia bacterium]
DCLDALLPVVAELLEGLTFDAGRLAAACDWTLMSTDVADRLVAAGVPFREAHHAVGALVRAALERGLRPDELASDELAALWPAPAPVPTRAELVALLEPAASLSAKESVGGSAPGRVREQLELARAALAGP